MGSLTEVFSAAHLRWITVKGALEWNIPTEAVMEFDYSQRKKIEAIFGWITDGRLHLKPLLTHRLPPEAIKDASEGLLHRKDEYAGVVLRWK
jgi:threonine dehydrogenase-like Zn-dependent dehydrogenase